jgi:FkbM family methyltransferase
MQAAADSSRYVSKFAALTFPELQLCENPYNHRISFSANGADTANMKQSRRKIEEMLWVAGLHGSARQLYARTFGRQAAEAQRKMNNFYSGVIQPGKLVFDIGANVGVLSASFASLGAKVVAVEPNADCVRHIQLSYPDLGINVIQAAVGGQLGLVVLNVADERDVRSSVSEEWMSTMSELDQSYNKLWSRRVVVPMVTLDSLIAQFGMPQFIKIDVEGFEEKVLSGLSRQPPLLSFEFTAAFLAPALNCLGKTVFQEASTFNFAYNSEDWGYPVRFEKDHWMDRAELERVLREVEGSDKQGDIFVQSP